MSLQLEDIKRVTAEARLLGLTHYRLSGNTIEFFDAQNNIQLSQTQGGKIWRRPEYSNIMPYPGFTLHPIEGLLGKIR